MFKIKLIMLSWLIIIPSLLILSFRICPNTLQTPESTSKTDIMKCRCIFIIPLTICTAVQNTIRPTVCFLLYKKPLWKKRLFLYLLYPSITEPHTCNNFHSLDRFLTGWNAWKILKEILRRVTNDYFHQFSSLFSKHRFISLLILNEENICYSSKSHFTGSKLII